MRITRSIVTICRKLNFQIAKYIITGGAVGRRRHTVEQHSQVIGRTAGNSSARTWASALGWQRTSSAGSPGAARPWTTHQQTPNPDKQDSTAANPGPGSPSYTAAGRGRLMARTAHNMARAALAFKGKSAIARKRCRAQHTNLLGAGRVTPKATEHIEPRGLYT